jgi:hypothetical protein
MVALEFQDVRAEQEQASKAGQRRPAPSSRAAAPSSYIDRLRDFREMDRLLVYLFFLAEQAIE